MSALDQELDDRWRADRDYVIADMNGSAVFLFAALKMKLFMAVRRRIAGGPGEQAAAGRALDVLIGAMDLPGDVRDAARAVSARRDRPAEARRLLEYFAAAATQS